MSLNQARMFADCDLKEIRIDSKQKLIQRLDIDYDVVFLKNTSIKLVILIIIYIF